MAPALVITVAFSFVLGASSALSEQRAGRVLNKASATGLLLYAVVLPVALGLSLILIAVVGTLLGIDVRLNLKPVLASYVAGLVLLHWLDRWRRSRR